MEHQVDQFEPDTEPEEPAPGIFDRFNNYFLLFYALACFLMYYSISGLLILRGSLILSLSIPGIIAFLIPLYVLSRRFSLKFREEYRLEAPDLLTAALVLLVSGSAILPVDALSSFFERRQPPEADYINFLLAIKPKGALSFLAIAFGTIAATPFTEELLFRGFIQRIFQRNMRGPLAVALAGIFFGLCHFSVPLLPGIVLLGLILGYVFYRTGNLTYPVIAHSLFNLISLLRLNALSESSIKAGEFPAPPLVWTFISAVGLILGILLLERHCSEVV